MFGPYLAKKDRTVSYKGNKIFERIDNVHSKKIRRGEFRRQVEKLHDQKIWPAITRINNQLNTTITIFFNEMGAFFIPLPLTTRMISSPGAVYGKEAIDYTTDTCPITLDWFSLKSKAFLAESSQIYLELALVQQGIDSVFANYHSFRKEHSDTTHLSEFHHVEFEGHVTQIENLAIIKALLKNCINDLIKNNEADLSLFIGKDGIKRLEKDFLNHMPEVTLKEALELLYTDTKDEIYKKFTLQNFGCWEETRLTQIIGGTVAVTQMPLLEVPFYHAMIDNLEPLVADNADIIGSGYREIIGCGHRVRSLKELKQKAEIFNLPKEDYKPYLQSRKFKDYKESSGFGMGWERLLQNILEMPFIYSASLFPRVHNTLKP